MLYEVITPNTTYNLKSFNSLNSRYFLYDINKKLISHVFNAVSSYNIITPSNAIYIKWFATSTDIQSKYQLEYGATATTYEPYKLSEIVYEPPFNDNQLTRVPNGSADEIDIATQRNKKYVLKSGDINGLSTINANNDIVTITKPTDYSQYNITTKSLATSQTVLIPKFRAIANVVDDTMSIGGIYQASALSVGLVVPKGTYANLAAAQADLAGTEIIYQLATPVKYDVPPQALEVFKSGT